MSGGNVVRTCIVAFGNLCVTPYINNYVNILVRKNISFDVIYWDRYSYDEHLDICENEYLYRKHTPDTTPLRNKLPKMLGYASFVKKILKKNNYDSVIVLTSLPGVMLERFLVKNFKNRYIFDIRDYSYEHMKWYYKKMRSLMNNSLLNIISSEGFRNFLPEAETYVMHNCTYENVDDYLFERSNDGKIKVGFVGVIRYVDECTRFIDSIKDSNVIEFHFYGSGRGEMKIMEYCTANNISNVFFHGRYTPEQKDGINRSIDVIFNVYGNNKLVRDAMSNKYYDALYYKKPLLVSDGTYVAKCSQGLSYVVEYKEGFSGLLEDWYNGINGKEFDKISQEYLMKAIRENIVTEGKIASVVSDTEVNYE